MDELYQAAGRYVAEATGAQAGFVTSCAAAGIALSVAACVTQGDLNEIERVPFVQTHRRKVVIQRGHSVSFGAEMLQMIRLGGGEPVEIGSTSKVEPYQLEGHLTEDVAAVLFVVSHHTVQSGMLSLERVVEISHQRGIPVIVDAAAETDLEKYVALGADLVVYSGHKALGGPTSGIVVGREELVTACFLQNRGIGRTMKIGKESIAGLIAAIEIYRNQTAVSDGREAMTRLGEQIGSWRGVQISVESDRTRPICRLKITLDPEQAGLTAATLVERLEQGDPVIKTRNHMVEHNVIQLDPRTMDRRKARSSLGGSARSWNSTRCLKVNWSHPQQHEVKQRYRLQHLAYLFAKSSSPLRKSM